MGIHRLLLLNIRKNGIFACHIIFPFNIIMIDFSKDPFDFAHISILSDQLLFFTKDTESYQPEIIEIRLLLRRCLKSRKQTLLE